MSTLIQDLGNAYAATAAKEALHSTSRKRDNNSLDMTDFLTLMVTQLQNQTMDDTADTSDMLNQLVQMQMVTAMTNMTDASIMGYASSLVGKEVTIGNQNSNGEIEETVIKVMGTGMANGEQVIFSEDGETYRLSSIRAVGRLPEKKPETPDETEDETTTPADKTETPVENPNKPTEPTGTTEPEDSKTGEVDPVKDPEAAENSVGR